jgi:hypothetical protein
MLDAGVKCAPEDGTSPGRGSVHRKKKIILANLWGPALVKRSPTRLEPLDVSTLNALKYQTLHDGNEIFSYFVLRTHTIHVSVLLHVCL